ncbi:MAG TPA: Ig-like domain-containing protein, partial [Candidatus Binatia bacterium]|nr:Ig-like domain-containing protein [Candidatus Binatia bacterium]
MNGGRDVRDAELEELFEEPDDREFAQFLRSVPHEQVEADPAFKMALRRRLAEEAWKLKEPRLPWYRRLLGPPALAWSGALAGVILILFATLTLAHSGRGGVHAVTVASPLDHAQAVSTVKPITLEFSQPMDQRATQQAVEVHPATQVAYRWSSPRTLEVTPQNGSLAPGTRYEVTVSAAARTTTNQQLGKPATMSFVTAQATPAPPATPAAPAPSPSRPPSQLLDAHQVGPAGPPAAVWSQDGSQLYVVGPAGQLSAYPAGGSVAQPVADRDVRLVAPGPQGPAYARGQDLVYGSLTLAGVNPSAIGFHGSQLLYLQGQTVVNGQPGLLAPNGTKVAELDRAPTAASFAPDGSRLAYLGSDGLHLVNVADDKDQLVGPATVLGDWSADSSRFAYANGSTVLETGGGAPTPVLSVSGANAIDWSAGGQLLLSGPSG